MCLLSSDWLWCRVHLGLWQEQSKLFQIEIVLSIQVKRRHNYFLLLPLTQILTPKKCKRNGHEGQHQSDQIRRNFATLPPPKKFSHFERVQIVISSLEFTLVNIKRCWANSHCWKWGKYQKEPSHLVSLVSIKIHKTKLFINFA